MNAGKTENVFGLSAKEKRQAGTKWLRAETPNERAREMEPRESKMKSNIYWMKLTRAGERGRMRWSETETEDVCSV